LRLLKQLTAILLIGVLFFNWYGYRLLTAWWQEQAEHRLEALLDADAYEYNEYVTPVFIKMPVNSLSYYNSTTDFERVDGQIMINGVPYKFVKRRLFKDSLEMICIPDLAAIRLQAADREFFRQVNDLEPASTRGHSADHNSAHQKNPQKDYSATTAMNISPLLNVHTTSHPLSLFPSALQTGYLSNTERPPDHFCSSI
jgi:hypothetical protein